MSELDNLAGGIVAVGVGGAVGSAVHPVMEAARQAAWREVVDPKKGNTSRPLDVGTLARLLAQGAVTLDKATDEAKASGYNANKLAGLAYLAQVAPSIAGLLELWRRDQINLGQVNHGLAKAQIEPQYWAALRTLKLDLLDPGQLAAAIHRGLIPDPGLLKGEQPKPPFNVEAYPVYPIDALVEALGNGFDRDHLGTLVGLQGLPMGVIEAAQAYYRKIITHGDYIRAFNESNNRNEWADSVLEYARQIPTARDFFENALRGYHTLEWAQNEAKRHGMTPEDSLVIYQNQGRPMNIRQITQALSRGGVFNPEPGELKDPYEASVVEGNIKPAYYDLAKSLKYTLPSPFVMRSMAQTGVWTEAKTAKRLKDAGWIPQDADEAAAEWAKGTGASADPHITKAQNQLWTATHRSYLTGELVDADATPALEAAGVATTSISAVLVLWAHEANLARKKLTAAQIKKAWQKAARNEATGLPWTRDEAIFALRGWGYPPLEAADYLNIP